MLCYYPHLPLHSMTALKIALPCFLPCFPSLSFTRDDNGKQGPGSALLHHSQQVSVPLCTCHLHGATASLQVCSSDLFLDVREPGREEGFCLSPQQDQCQVRIKFLEGHTGGTE